ncbi:DNA-binding response regulator [Halolactibacillus alkaliphilus]|uniref:DNA-binding response regulator n=1 Tax=Halolactibacillus alkaliphilus TaxID=442899 RepID=A0A511X182_9BACI|nr:response regulator transcription factor [Halolactibacillus alkaliphilus]GEN56712.1 DNA-binding response regulator [Halolactibacillus alkaliphilus]GGN70017.1 DNA-binding response regulator [Halolactibacillus alkaliphilus]SFO78067.1 two-component system, OmpR family, response regulator ResD [Halolactibacillus alkaliphilus]
MEQQQTILVVEDEDRIRKLITMYLGREGFQTAEAADGHEGLQLALENDYALIILDLMLPEMNGIDLCKALRKEKTTPVLMLTAKGEENHRIEGFEAGADDYVVKPFSPREVVLRVKALLRRSPHVDVTITDTPTKNVLEFKYMVIDHDAHKVTVEGQELTLTPKEYELLYFLASHEERVYDREQLLKEVWKYEFFGDLRTVDTHVKRLREKLSKVSKEAAQMIVTVWGVGYKFEVDDH